MSTKIVTNFIWRFLERTLVQLISVIVLIFLSRVLEPVEFGTVAIVLVYINILQVFVDCGMASALIQKKNADDLDFSSVFYMNLFFCSLIYLIMFFLAPIIAQFYKMPELISVIRVLSIIIIIYGIRNIQQAYIAKNLIFKKLFYSTCIGSFIAAIISIYMAYNGYGIWALVLQYLVNTLVATIVLWLTVQWRPKLIFSFNRLKELFSYSWKLLVSSLLDTTYNNLRQLIIGKLYTRQDLAFYDKGNMFPHAIVSNIDTSINSVLFPAMSAKQDNIETIKNMASNAMKISTYIIIPLMVGLAVCSEPIVILLLTEKWLPCVPYIRIFCVTFAFYPIHTVNLNTLKALGRSDLFLRLEIIKKIVGLIVLSIAMWHGAIAIAYSLILTSISSQIINSYPNRKLINYGYIKQLKDILPNITISCIMGVIVYSIIYLKLDSFVTLLIQIPLGIVVYILISKVFQIYGFEYIIGFLKGSIKWKK